MSRKTVARLAIVTLATLGALAGGAGPAAATEYTANPGNYREVVPTLEAGDVLTLEAGTYTRTLPITGLRGRADAWITIRGPATGAPAVFVADPGPCCNTVELVDTSYLALEHLVIDGNGVDGAFGISAKSGEVHHIRIEGCTLRGHAASQQTVAISTKVATWGWIIRGNRITEAGTGLYLGNSDGSAPFVEGVIEHNLVTGTVGYGMQIKFQTARPAALPPGPTRTLIRHNVFLKDDRPSPDGDRPNLLVGAFPTSGAGAQDRYEIYGNLLVHNPREALLQASGRVSIHDNVFVDTSGAAIVVVDHDRPLVSARIYHNTIFGAATGVRVGSAGDTAAGGVAIAGNLVFAATPIAGGERARLVADNQLGAEADAATVVTAPSRTLGVMDFYPRPGQAQGSALDPAILADDVDGHRDFNGADKGGLTFRGAYAGAGANPGWPLSADIKTLGAGPGDGDAGPDGGSGVDEPGGGCGCQGGDTPTPTLALGLVPGLVLLGLARLRRRRAGRAARTTATRSSPPV